MFACWKPFNLILLATGSFVSSFHPVHLASISNLKVIGYI